MSHDTRPRWPSLSYDEWGPTRQTLHRYLQLVGKIRMSLVPSRYRWGHTTLQLATRGLTTGPMPYGEGEVEILFDLLDHRLLVLTSDGRERTFHLGSRPACADFYGDLFAALDDLGLQVDINPVPYDLGEGPPFPEDTIHRTYDAEAVTDYWRVLAGTEHVLSEFASEFAGEASPVQLFWHLMDLSYTRHAAPRDAVLTSEEGVARGDATQVIGFGFSPGDERDIAYPAFHSYTAPEPERLVDEPLEPEQAQWRGVGSSHRAVLPYDAMRMTSDPSRTLLDFYRSAYLAGARTAGWDVAAHSTGLPAQRDSARRRGRA
jgi:hypothetical protein